MKWKRVPVEPTPEMLVTPQFWELVLEAAPQPPKLSDERIWEIYDELVAEVAKGGSMFNFARAIEREILGGGHE